MGVRNSQSGTATAADTMIAHQNIALSTSASGYRRRPMNHAPAVWTPRLLTTTRMAGTITSTWAAPFCAGPSAQARYTLVSADSTPPPIWTTKDTVAAGTMRIGSSDAT